MSGNLAENPSETVGIEGSLKPDTSTALWVINHHHTTGASGSNGTGSDSTGAEGHSKAAKIGLSNSLSHSQLSANRGLQVDKDALTRSKSVDIKNSTDDLSSIASTQTRLRLQLKRVKLFSLRKFRNSQKQPMHSSNESINSEDSGSTSLNSSFISLARPSFPLGIKSPECSVAGSQRSLKSPLLPFNPSPAFNHLAHKLLMTSTVKVNSDNNNIDIDAGLKGSQTSAVLKSPSDSTILNDSSCDSGTSSETDEGADLQSPPTIRSNHIAQIPELLVQSGGSNGFDGGTTANTDNSKSDGCEAKRHRKKNGRGKVRTGALAKTHPPFMSRPEIEEEKSVARDDNNFPFAPYSHRRIEEEPQEAKILSNDSLFPSDENLVSEESALVREVLEELKKTPAVHQKSSRGGNRIHKSEPFPNGMADQFVGASSGMAQSKSSPAIHQSLISLKSVQEDSMLTDPENDLVEEPEEEDTAFLCAQRDSQRRKIVLEIVDSEQKYVNNLGQISEAVKQIREKKILDEESLYTIFHNIRLTESAVHHSILLTMLNNLVSNNKWNSETSNIGSIMFDTFKKEGIQDNYQVYVKNCEKSKSLIKQQLVRNAAFSRFNEKFKERNQSGFDLRDAIMLPANRLSSYLTLLERYIKHTPADHPDFIHVPKAITVVRALLDRAGKMDSRSKQETLQIIEKLLELSELQSSDREFLRVDTVTIPGDMQEYRLWLFTDLLLITINRIPRQSSTRKPSIVIHGQHGQDILPGHRRFYKLHKRVGLEDTEVLNSPENEVKQYADDMHHLESDLRILKDIRDKSQSLSKQHEALSRQVADMIGRCERDLHLLRQRTQETDLASLKLQIQTSDGVYEYRMVFTNSKCRSAWEKDLYSAKLNLETAIVNKLPPEYLNRIPVEKTRAGMQFTCAAASLAMSAEKEIWFCNSDSSAGHVCRLAVCHRPALIDITPVPGCTSRISCICATPGSLEPELHIFDSPSSSPRLDTRQALMWLGSEDGVLHVVSAISSSQPFQNGHIRINCEQPVLSIAYVDNKVFVALNKRKIQIYHRNHDGSWNLDKPRRFDPTSQGMISHLLPVADKLWCGCGNEISIIDPESEKPERSFNVSSEKNVSIQSMAYSRQGVVAVALKSSCDIKLFNHTSLKHIADVNIFSTVAQKLSKCDEIIKQHKTACLKITSLVCCKHILWVGTTAGVVLTLRIPKILANDFSQRQFDLSNVDINSLNIGHTGNVRFLTFAELITDSKQERRRSVARQSLISKLLVISGGDGYEVIDPTQQPKETVGFNDSINHLLAWKM